MKKSIVRLGLASSAVLAFAALPGCGIFSSDDPPANASAPVGPTKEAAENNAKPPVPGEALDGVFVSSSRGDDVSADGSMARPWKTLGAAFAAAAKNGKRVLACAETYPESVVVPSGVSAYGYFGCAGGAFVMDAAKRARIEAPSSPALSADGVTLPTRIEGFEIVAPAGTADAPSSIAVRAKGSKLLTISQSKLIAGDGLPGADGAAPTATPAAGGVGEVGRNGGVCGPATVPCFLMGQTGNLPGEGASAIECGDGVVSGPGGAGGYGASYNTSSQKTFDPKAGVGGGPTTAPGGAVDVYIGGAGQQGANGARGLDGANGTISFEAEGIVVKDGSRGSDGRPGQGGGGGAAQARFADGETLSASGAGGGAGGCPGRSGTPGTTGGSSIAVYSARSELVLDGVQILASRGGRAGRGSLGSAPAAGGAGGLGTRRFTSVGGNTHELGGGHGGAGGSGGAAGVSGHGAPGASVGIVSIGTAAVVRGGSIQVGAGGEEAPETSDLGGTLPATGPGLSKDHLVVP